MKLKYSENDKSENDKREGESTYAKHMLSQSSSNTKISSLEWIKETDKLSVVTPEVRVNRITK